MAVIAFFTTFFAQNANADELKLYGDKHIVRLHSHEKLNKNASRAFRGDFRKKSYYAAFAFSPSGPFSWENGHNTLRTAIEYAMSLCQERVRPGEMKCILYSTIVPKGYSEGKGLTLSRNGTRFYKSFLKKSGPGAIAINDAGTVRERFGDSLKQAKATALFDCNAAAKQYATSSLKVYKCRIIASKK